MNNFYRVLPFIVVGLFSLFAGCTQDGEESPEPVQSILSGRLSVSAEVDSVADYRDFDVLVFRQVDTGLDTLGHAVTDRTGAFRMEITAPERGIYSIAISRRGMLLKLGDIVVAEDDTATIQATFPMSQSRPLIIRSQENGALMAYVNARAQYDQSLVRLVRSGQATEPTVDRSIRQTASTLWSMRENYGGTLGAQLAAAESIVMLPESADSLVVERAQAIEPENPSYVEVVRAARRAQARLHGPEAGLELLEAFTDKARAKDLHRQALEAERVVALMESDRRDEALEAARALAEQNPDTEWAGWADRVAYDLEHMMPGMPAPAFSVTSLEGETVTLDSLLGRHVLLEFYQPHDPTYQREITARNALYEGAHDMGLEIVSVSVQPDSAINQAFYDGRELPGIRVIATGGLGSQITQHYNVHVLPKRVIIGPDGRIVSNYEGAYMPRIIEEVATLLTRDDLPPS